MRVVVDDAGCDYETAGVDLLPGRTDLLTNLGDTAIGHGQLAGEDGGSRAITDSCVAEREVVHDRTPGGSTALRENR